MHMSVAPGEYTLNVPRPLLSGFPGLYVPRLGVLGRDVSRRPPKPRRFEAGGREEFQVRLTRHGSGDSRRPRVCVRQHILGNRFDDEKVGRYESASGAQDSVDFLQGCLLVGHEVENAVGAGEVERRIGEGQ